MCKIQNNMNVVISSILLPDFFNKVNIKTVPINQDITFSIHILPCHYRKKIDDKL